VSKRRPDPVVRLINIFVTNLAEAREWYGKVLGFRVTRELPPLALQLQHRGAILLLHLADRPSPVRYGRDASVSLALWSTDLHQDLGRLKSLGVDLVTPEPRSSPFGDWAALRDPFGNVVELVEFRESAGG
jgi:lactoylglutathione lyase